MDYTFEHPLFDDYPDPVFTLDLKGKFTSVNKALVRLAECSREELLQMTFDAFVDAENIGKVSDIFQNASKGEIQNFEAEVVSAKGTPLTLCITNIPIVSNGIVKGVYAIAQDIADQKKTEQKLAEYNHRISAILESITDAFFAVDKNWIVTYWNREAVRLLDTPRKEIVGKNLWEVFEDARPLKFYDEYHIAMIEQISRRFEEYYPAADLWVEVSAYPSPDGLSVYFRDITGRKNAENQLKIEKERYHTLFNLSPLPQWVYEVESLKFLDVNAAAIKHYGYSRKEFLSLTLRDIRPLDELKSFEKTLNVGIRDKSFHQSLVRHLKKNGEIIIVKAKGNHVTYEDKNARLVVAVDETEKIGAIRSLEASEKRFKALVQDGSDLIAILDNNGNYSYVSPTSKSVLGIEDSALINRNILSFIHEEDKKLFAGSLLHIKPGQHVKIPPLRFKDEDGNYRWIETIITDMSDDPAISGIIANSRDVTQRIVDNMKTKESIDRLDILSKATTDAIWDWNFLTDDLIWNNALATNYGYPELRYSMQWWYDNLHPDDSTQVIEQLDTMIKNRETNMTFEYRFRCYDGTYKDVLDRAFVIFNNEGEPIRMIGSLQDISERNNYIRSIEDQNRRLREIAWVQSHVVRAPLSRIMGLTKLIFDKNTSDELKKELLTHLDTSAEELDEIIRDIIKKSEEINLLES